jgi:hypothetical protein
MPKEEGAKQRPSFHPISLLWISLDDPTQQQISSSNTPRSTTSSALFVLPQPLWYKELALFEITIILFWNVLQM